MVDFVNPGLLGSSASFKKNYEVPIVKARQPNARKEVMDLGRKKSEELSLVTGMFMLRRTSEILTKYLPRKRMVRKRERLMIDEYVVFCKPSGLQERAYLALLQSQGLKNCLYQDDMSSHLKAITLMRKLCNGVSLVSSKVESVLSPSYVFLIEGTR
jgi:DNA repair and recombination protein RAD54B